MLHDKEMLYQFNLFHFMCFLLYSLLFLLSYKVFIMFCGVLCCIVLTGQTWFGLLIKNFLQF